jgi:hypothetical protein
MVASIVQLSKNVGLIAAFSLAGFVSVKIAFAVVCWGIGHDSFEAIAGLVASIGLGGWIGIEAYLSFTSWRANRKVSEFDTSR